MIPYKKPIYAISRSDSHTNQLLKNIFGDDPSMCDICVTPYDEANSSRAVSDSKIGINAGTWGLAGGALGTAVGVMAGLGAFSIPGLVQLFVMGALIGALTALTALPSARKTAFEIFGVGFSESESRQVMRHISEDGYLISINAKNEMEEQRIRKILNRSEVKEITIS